MQPSPFKPRDIARRIAKDLWDGAYVNLGIGQPELVADFVPAGRDVIFHSENGLLGMGPPPPTHLEDPELINAGKKPVTLVPGGAYFHHADSFAMVRGGRLDICVMGAFEVSARGDLANWHSGAVDAIPAVGGAMDLARGAKRVFVMMSHVTRDGRPKVVAECALPLTAPGVVSRIYTDLAVIAVEPTGLVVMESAPGLDFDALQAMTAAPLQRSPDWRELSCN